MGVFLALSLLSTLRNSDISIKPRKSINLKPPGEFKAWGEIKLRNLNKILQTSVIWTLIWGFWELYPNWSMLRLFLESGHKYIVYYGSGFLSWGNPELEVSHLILLPRTRSSFPQEKQLEGYLGNEGRGSVSQSYETPQGDCQGQGKICPRGKGAGIQDQTADVENSGWAALNREKWTFHFVNPFLLKIILISFEKYPWVSYIPVL